MENAVLHWPITAWEKNARLPSSILTERPAILSPAVPVEIGLMLPARADRDGLPVGPDIPKNIGVAALGIFLANPFFSLEQVVPSLVAASVRWISNFPTVGFQDPEFSRQLSDVGFSPDLEIEKAARLVGAGFDWLAVVSDPAYTDAFLGAGPAAILAMPRMPDYTAGFPSPRVRAELAANIVDTVARKGLDVPVLGFGQTEEAERPSLWPRGISGLVARASVERPRG